MGNRRKQPALTSGSIIGIVNRGEPAIRFIRAVGEYNSARGTELKTVAFYLDEEAEALFVLEADIAVAFHTVPGAPQAGNVYLQQSVIIDALNQAGCDAVWVGWGFVAEDAEFAGQVEDAGMVFLGPSADAMGRLGDKIAAKELADQTGVPILPWSRRPIRDSEDAHALAQQIGYPVIVKAANAGGGRGIRFVMRPDELDEQYHSAREETVRITGNDIVFMERLVTTGRHLEVQCLCDQHGNVFTFGVRDCSVQRRNQKIIEETPAPGMTVAQIGEMEAAAGRLMKAAGYESAGTVEFLHDLDRDEFYFMEVNTRLQVEHTITEVLYDVDLVKGQIQVAFGEELRLQAKKPRGWVIEARLNAEDPDRDFAPAPGTVRRFRVPLGPGIRVDSGIVQGSVIPSIFDSMVAKVIASGSTRAEALARLRRALLETRVAIDGGTTNKAFLLELIGQDEIRRGAVNTTFVEQLLEAGRRTARTKPGIALIAGAIDSYGRHESAELVVFRQQIANYGYPRRTAAAGDHEVTLGIEGNSYAFVVRRVGPVAYRILVDGAEFTASCVHNGDDSRLEISGERYSIQTVQRGDALQCEVDGIPYLLEMESGGAVKAPSPAIVLSAHVQEGQAVEKGQRLISLEAMKMEMIIESPAAGIVREIVVKSGQQVTAGDVLVQLDAAEDSDESGDARGSGTRSGAAERVTFPTDPDDPGDRWDRLAEAFGATFFGYDRPTKPLELFDTLEEMAREPALANRLFDLIYRMLEACVRIDSLFSAERIHSEHFARSISWQELIFVYFQYSMAGSETLPQQFTESLETAMRYYPTAGTESGAWSGFYHMHRAQRAREQKNAVIRSMLFTLEGLGVPHARNRELLQILDDLIHLNRIGVSTLTDAALHARYELYDRISVMNLRNRRRDWFQEQLRVLLDNRTDREAREETLQALVDAGAYAEYELLHAYHGSNPERRAQIVDLVARRIVRDRNVTNCKILDYEGEPGAVVTAEGIATVVTLCTHPEDATLGRVAGLLEQVAGDGVPPEVLLLVLGEGEDESIISRFSDQSLPVRWLSVGVYRDAHAFTYRTFHNDRGDWTEDRAKREFSPLFYRELRVGRLSAFETDVVYHSDSVYLVLATARQNPRDQRLFAYGSASESQPEVDESGRIERVDEFDQVFLEAVHKMRSEQSGRARRLLWNRIVIHMRHLSPTTAVQIKEYGNRIIPQTNDLGLEKAVIYTRRKRWSESVVRELELLFLNISEVQ
ncbi:MAG: biotin carboxylase N-terminal domain-containing protein, partial [Spirochaetia bacterium]